MKETAEELERIVETAGRALLELDDEAAARRAAPDKWSRKEVLGHLIDSASNNHQRFVRLQLEATLALPSYSQSDWVRVQDYHGRPWRELVELWSTYNRHLAHVMRRADPAASTHVWRGPSRDADLAFLVTDYVRHLKHHLGQIL